jgi:hypothetical protein
VALPFSGVAVTLILSCLPLGFPITVFFALGVPSTLRINVSPSQPQKDDSLVSWAGGWFGFRLIFIHY